jgi:hypothetical protein
MHPLVWIRSITNAKASGSSKQKSFCLLVSTSTNDLTCVTQAPYGYGLAQVIDPATGKVLHELPKQYVASYGNYNYKMARTRLSDS